MVADKGSISVKAKKLTKFQEDRKSINGEKSNDSGLKTTHRKQSSEYQDNHGQNKSFFVMLKEETGQDSDTEFTASSEWFK